MTTQLWFERIGALQLLGGVLRHGWRRKIRFLAPAWSPTAERVVHQLARLSRGRISGERRSLELGRVDAEGRALAYRREQFMLVVSEAFASLPGPVPTGLSDDEFRRLLGSYVVTKSREALSFVVMVEAECASAAGKVLCHVAFPTLGTLTAEVLNRHTLPGLRVRAQASPRAVIEYMRFLPGHPRQWRRFWRSGAATEAAAIEPQARTAGVVLEEAYWLSLHHYPSAGHLYWAEASGLPASQVALYCDRADTPCDAQLRHTAAEHGFGWIDGADLLTHHGNPRQALVAALRATRGLLPRGLHAARWMRWALATASLIRVECYREMLRRHNVVALHHFIEYSPEGIALCLAARREDVVTLWNMWSVLPFLLSRYRWAIADLILVWGPLDRDFHRACGFDYQAIAEVGMIDADGIAAEDDAAAQSLRARMSPSVRFVITAFDTSFGPMLHNSETDVREFLGTIIDLVERYADWGMIIKPKKRPEDSCRSGLDHRLLALEEQQRCVILEPKTKAGVAAQAADLVVGIPINSAAEVGALRGRPTLHLDLTGMIDGPLHQCGKAAGIVHADLGSFTLAIERIAAGETGVIDRSAWAGLIDRFNDHEGRWRAGAIIGDFVRLRQTLSAKAALAAAIERHAAAYGRDRVITPTTQLDSLWAPIEPPPL